MNAVKYWEWLKRPWEIVIFLPCLLLAVYAAVSRIIYLRGLPPTRELIIFMVGILVLSVIPVLIPLWWRRWFARRHPEMAYLNEWVKIKGTAEGYPTNDEEKLVLWPDRQQEIDDLARGADFFFAERDEMRKRVRTFFCGSPKRVAAGAVLVVLEKLADDANRKYLALWDLYVGKLKLFNNELRGDPNKHREFLREWLEPNR